MKRANENEVVEVPNPNLVSSAGVQQQAGPGQPLPSFRPLNREEVSGLSPEQLKQYRDRQAQHQYRMFFSHIDQLTREIASASPPLKPVVMDELSRARIIKVLTAPGTRQMLTRFSVFLYQYFLMTKDLNAVKQLLSYKMHLFPQYTGVSIRTNTWEPAEQFTIDADYAEAAVKDVLARFNHVMSRVGAQPPVATAAPLTDANGSHPLSADNLKKHQDMQVAQRAKRPAQEVPPAPTASQPPFTFNDGSPRGQGTPRYAPAGPKQGLKQEDLKLPSKRQKKAHPDNTVSTPVGGQATPAMSPQAVKPQRVDELPLKCSVVGCAIGDKGFITKGELDRHSNTAHKPVEEYIADPLAFFLESMRDGLGLDANGEPKVKPEMERLKVGEMQQTIGKTAGAGSKPSTPGPSAAAMARGISQTSGPKGASPNPSHIFGAKGRAGGDTPRAPVVTNRQPWDESNVSFSDLRNTFGDLIGSQPHVSLNHHDPLSASNYVAEFMDEFMESEAWTKMQGTGANIDAASSKATQSPAQQSEPGQGSSDISKGDDLFIKIGAEDTELAESWALPELRLEPESGTAGADDIDDWMKMDFEDASLGAIDVNLGTDMDFEWKKADWSKFSAEPDKPKVGAISGKD